MRLLVLPPSAFQKGLQIRMTLDGKIRPHVRTRASFTMTHVYRGKIVTVSPVVGVLSMACFPFISCRFHSLGLATDIWAGVKRFPKRGLNVALALAPSCQLA